MRIIATICSADKDRREGLLPARQRYRSERIDLAYGKSRQAHLPFYILSGKFGLVEAETLLPSYDHLLDASEVPESVRIVADQIRTAGITAIAFLARAKDTPGWKPYWEVMERACAESGVVFEPELIVEKPRKR